MTDSPDRAAARNAPLCECGRYAEVTEQAETRRKGLPWRRRTETKWSWVLRRPNAAMPYGWESGGGSGSAWSYLDALHAATARHDEWHEWDRREAEKRTINFGGTDAVLDT